VLKKLLLLSILSLLGFFAWKHFTAPPPAHATTPEQEVAALVEQSVMPAKDLAALCAKYPKLVTQALKHKPVAVSGLLLKGLVSGVNSNDLSLELEGAPQLKISFQSHFGKKERWGGPASFRFQKRGKEIVKISEVKIASEPHSLSGSQESVGGGVGARPLVATQITEQILCCEGNTLTLRGVFQHIGAGWIKCDLLELP
jgi:hypothetical protein